MADSSTISSRHPWGEVRTAYVEGILNPEGHRRYLSMDELAKHYGIHPRLVKKRAAREDWVGLRNDWVATIETARRRDKADRLAGILSEVDSESFRVARAGLALVARKMADLGNRRDENGNIIAPDGLELSRLAMSARVYQQIAKVAAGEADEASIPRMTGLANEGNGEFVLRIVRDGAGYDPPPKKGKVIDAP